MSVGEEARYNDRRNWLAWKFRHKWITQAQYAVAIALLKIGR